MVGKRSRPCSPSRGKTVSPPSSGADKYINTVAICMWAKGYRVRELNVHSLSHLLTSLTVTKQICSLYRALTSVEQMVMLT